MMFDIIFFVVAFAVAFSICVAAEIIAYRVVKRNEMSNNYEELDVCDACGEKPKAPNSQICKECQKKAYDD